MRRLDQILSLVHPDPFYQAEVSKRNGNGKLDPAALATKLAETDEIWQVRKNKLPG
jgi:hypothetical protein